MNENQNAQALINMIKDIKFTMLSTVSDDGTIHSRPMGTLKTDLNDFNGTLWFFSRKNSWKNHDIANDQHVNLAYADTDKHCYVSVSGKAFISDDKTKMSELWDPSLKTWFPDGLNDPELSLIGVNVESAEIWGSPSGNEEKLTGFSPSTSAGQAYNKTAEGQSTDLRS